MCFVKIKSSKMSDCMDCLIDGLCCLCFRCSKFEFIEPDSIDCYESRSEQYDPDYIPLYLEMDMSGTAHKYANMAP